MVNLRRGQDFAPVQMPVRNSPLRRLAPEPHSESSKNMSCIIGGATQDVTSLELSLEKGVFSASISSGLAGTNHSLQTTYSLLRVHRNLDFSVTF